MESPTKTVPKIAIKPILKINSIFLLRNPYWLQNKDKRNKEGIYDTSLIIKESRNIPNRIAAIADLIGEFLRENGNNQITGQHGDIPFILSQSGEINIKAGIQIAVTKINLLWFFLAIIYQNLNPINCFWRCS